MHAEVSELSIGAHLTFLACQGLWYVVKLYFMCRHSMERHTQCVLHTDNRSATKIEFRFCLPFRSQFAISQLRKFTICKLLKCKASLSRQLFMPGAKHFPLFIYIFLCAPRRARVQANKSTLADCASVSLQPLSLDMQPDVCPSSAIECQSRPIVAVSKTGDELLKNEKAAFECEWL